MVTRARTRAQGLVEYGLIIALVAVLAIAALIIFGPAVSSFASKLGLGSV
ncbi:MAG: pilus assembly protein [Chloroflexi bacterium]|nr:pilus assembly protein [Chloroflexota bacterium]